MVTDTAAQPSQQLSVQLRPNKEQTLQGKGTVSRCSQKENGEYIIAVDNINWEEINATAPKAKPVENELRKFPRITANCPARYFDSVTQYWQTAHLINLSATGLLMHVEVPVLEGSEISIQVEPGDRKTVPAIRCFGTVARCDLTDEGDIRAAIDIDRIETP